MINVAVMISGHPKFFNLTYKFFQHWNKLYDNVKFDFYVSMWENDYDKEKIFGWTKAYETLYEKDCPYDLSKHESGRHQPHYSWALYKVNELRKKHQEIEYNAVIQTRGDAIFSRLFLDSIVDNLTQIRGGKIPLLDSDGNHTGKSKTDIRPNPQISDKNILSAGGNFIHSYEDTITGELIQNLWTEDVWFMGTPKVMDIFCNIFYHKFSPNEYMLHIMQAEYLNHMRIYNTAMNNGVSFTFVRESHRFGYDNDDGGYPLDFPTPNQIERIINENSMDWFYCNDNIQKTYNPSLRSREIEDYFIETKKI